MSLQRRSGPQRKPSVDELVQGVRGGDRAALGRAITMLESENPAHQQTAQQLLVQLLPHTGDATRVGITGVPGVGKSTLIESLGTHLLSLGHRVAVLAVDPSSRLSGGSIMGDKTRMARLANEPAAFVRPSPSGGSLGGVARKSREALLVCEAAGFDVILVETVGVGQSETSVAEMVDFFLLLMLAGAGDELQGIKRGVLELADLVAITKSDGSNAQAAARARRQYEASLQLMRPRSRGWAPPVLTCSAKTGDGLDQLWKTVMEHRELMSEAGELQRIRRQQLLSWMWSLVEEGMMATLREHPEVRTQLPELETAVREGRTTAGLAAQSLLKILFDR